MDGQYSWKKTKEMEIDLTDLLKRMCMHWKIMLALALAAAVMLGGYGWLRQKSSLDTDASAAEEELSESEEQAVMDAVRLNQNITGLKTYLDHSILMQLDPYRKVRRVMLYHIDDADRQQIPGIMESYLSFISNGGAADLLAESDSRWNMDRSYLAEVISSYQKTFSYPDQVIQDAAEADSHKAEALFYVEIIGETASTAENMASDMKDVLEEYSGRVKKKAGAHRLVMVSNIESITIDSGLQSQQNEKRALLSSYKTNLKTLTDAFTKEQKAAYKKEAGFEKETGFEKEESGEIVSDEDSGAVKKYMLLGFLGGIFIYGGIFSIRYLYNDTVKSTEEMKRMYTFPVYGEMMVLGRRSVRKMSGMQTDTFGHTQEQVWNRIRLACKKQKLSKLCAASAFSLDIQERAYLESMAEKLADWNIDVAVTENISMDTDAWEGLAETGNVLMICRIGETTHRMIDDAMNFYLENGITVVGAAAFSE